MEPGKRKEQRVYAHNDIGKRLKEIREASNLTLDRMSADSGISRSYLAEFERGAKMPNSKYLTYLFKRHNANLHSHLPLDFLACLTASQTVFICSSVSPDPEGKYRPLSASISLTG